MVKIDPIATCRTESAAHPPILRQMLLLKQDDPREINHQVRPGQKAHFRGRPDHLIAGKQEDGDAQRVGPNHRDVKKPRAIRQHVGHDRQRGRENLGKRIPFRERQHQAGNRRQAIHAQKKNRRDARHSAPPTQIQKLNGAGKNRPRPLPRR